MTILEKEIASVRERVDDGMRPASFCAAVEQIDAVAGIGRARGSGAVGGNRDRHESIPDP